MYLNNTYLYIYLQINVIFRYVTYQMEGYTLDIIYVSKLLY